MPCATGTKPNNCDECQAGFYNSAALADRTCRACSSVTPDPDEGCPTGCTYTADVNGSCTHSVEAPTCDVDEDTDSDEGTDGSTACPAGCVYLSLVSRVKENQTAMQCNPCPPGSVCAGGKPQDAAIYAPANHWIDVQRVAQKQSDPVVYSCFADHCRAWNRCRTGHHGLLCESCTDGYRKQNDRCTLCKGGATWMSMLGRFILKTALTTFLCAKLLEKATVRTYTANTAFATVIFTLQTVALAVEDSYGTLLSDEAPAVAAVVGTLQSLLNPDRCARVMTVITIGCKSLSDSLATSKPCNSLREWLRMGVGNAVNRRKNASSRAAWRRSFSWTCCCRR